MDPLITHRIGIGVCFQRQTANYHKCHRCVYRGKPADFEAASRIRLTPQLPATGGNGSVELPQPAPKTAAQKAGATQSSRDDSGLGTGREKKPKSKKSRSEEAESRESSTERPRATSTEEAGRAPG